MSSTSLLRLGSRVSLLSWAAASWVVGCNVYTDDLIGDDASGGDGGDDGKGSGGLTSAGGRGSGGDETGGEGGEGPTGGKGSGGSSGSGGSGGTNPGTTYELIDDMEDGNATVLSSHGRTGRWNVYNDGTAGTQEPAENFSDMEDVSSDPPHDESLYAAYTAGNGFTDWGAVLNVTMKSGGAYVAYDASAYSGLGFYAKVGTGITPRSVKIRLVTADTANPDGGVCKEPPVGPGEIACYDHFALDVVLTASWKYYEISFDDFARGDSSTPLALDLSKLFSIEFLSEQDTFELWIDDLAFAVAE